MKSTTVLARSKIRLLTKRLDNVVNEAPYTGERE
jgi:hypothetical protein